MTEGVSLHLGFYFIYFIIFFYFTYINMHLPVLALITEDLLLIKKEYKHFTAKVLENYGILYFAFH